MVQHTGSLQIKESQIVDLQTYLTSFTETNDLSQRQNVIMSQLKDVGPLMQQAMNLIKNVDMDAINSISNKMTGMIGNLQQLKDENNN